MKIVILICLLFTLNAFSEEIVNCETSMPLSGQPITALAETKCLIDDFTKESLKSLVKEKTTKKFCKGCNNHLMGLGLSDPKEQELNKQIYSKATMNELQKQLAFITVDLMKMRSSFSLKIDSKDSVKSCNFDNLKRPSCLNSSNRDFLEKEIGKIQNTMATELASILSSTPILNDGFFKRTTPNSCEIKDNEFMFAQMRYHESLLTKDLIDIFKKINIRKGVSITDSISELKTGSNQDFIESTRKLYSHPLMKSMFNEPEKFKAFLAQVSSSDPIETVIDKLYQSETAQNFGAEISARCGTLFKSTGAILEKVYCNKESPYLAMNANSMSLLNGKGFKDLADDDAEASIQKHCAYINTSLENKAIIPTNFDEVLEINANNDPLTSTLPIENFKTEAYKTIIGNNSRSVCSAMKDKSICKKEPMGEQCQTLSFLEESRQEKHYKELANSSDESINSILRSLVGKGLPEKDGKVDQVAVKLLQDEGIFLGGDIAPRDPSARDAGTFFKAVNSGNPGSNSTPVSQTKTTQNSTTQFKPTTGTSADVDESSDEDPTRTSKSTTSNNLEDIKKIDKKFSALSDEEQKNILNRMKPKRKTGKSDVKGFSPDAQKDSDPFFANGAEESSTGSFNNQGTTTTSITVPTNPLAQNTSGSKSGNYAKIDPTVVKKDGSYNKALEQANNNDRSPASNLVEETKFALTKNESGLNEIEIKVADESILEKKTPELEKKIQEYLEKSGQSLTGAKKGEAFIVKLGKYKIKVAINDYGAYVATCAKGEAIHPEYLAFLSRYFTGIKDRVSSRLSMEKIINEESVKRN